MITTDMRPDYYGEASAMYRHEAETDALALSFDDLARHLGYRPHRLRNVIGSASGHRGVRCALATFVTDSANVLALAAAWEREVGAVETSYAQAAE